MKNKRPKKWIGAAIGAGVGLISQLVAQNQQNKALKEQNALDAKRTAEQNALLTAQNLTNQYNNQEYIDAMKDKVVFKTGGAVYGDRIKNLTKFKCGGKKR